jgi:hypothetical protein
VKIDREYNGNEVHISNFASVSFTISRVTLQIIHSRSERLIAMKGDDCITTLARAFENISTLSFNSVMPKTPLAVEGFKSIQYDYKSRRVSVVNLILLNMSSNQ